MTQKPIILAVLACLILGSLACSLPLTVTIGQSTQPPVEMPTQPPAPEATSTPEEIPPTPTVDVNIRRLGAILVDPADQKGVNLIAPDGSFNTELILGTDLNLMSNSVVPASVIQLPPETTRVLFYTYQGYALSQYWGPGDIRQQAVVPDMVALVGDSWCDAFSYGTIALSGDGAQNDLYVAKSQSLGNTPAVVSELDPRGFGIFPVSAVCGEGQPGGVWYAHMPYGIGGDIVFPPYSGLYRFNAGDSSKTLILDENQRFSGISPDQNLVAYSPRENNTILYILDVKKNSQVSIQTLPGSDRGAGYAVFSPDGSRVAWLEGSGFQMSETPNFQGIIRIAPSDVNVQLDKQKTDAEFGAAVGLPKLWVKPVAWLDNTNLLVEGRGESWDMAYLLKLNTDTGAITLFAKGAFLDLVYSEN
jgi:hypothetical protein